MKLIKPFWFLWMLLLLLPLVGRGQGAITVMADRTNGTLRTPTTFLVTNILAGANIVITPTNSGRIYISSTASGEGGAATNIYRSAAGTGITITTNDVSLLYTISAPAIGSVTNVTLLSLQTNNAATLTNIALSGVNGLTNALAWLTNNAGGGGATNLGELKNNLIWVSVDGDNDTAARESPDKPFQTITAAIAAAQAGDTIVVGAGEYVESGLGGADISFILSAGCIVGSSNTLGGPIFSADANTLNIFGDGLILATNSPVTTANGGVIVFRGATLYPAPGLSTNTFKGFYYEL